MGVFKRGRFKILLVIIMGIMILSLAGCGGGNNETGGNGESEQAAGDNSGQGEDVSITDMFGRAKEIKGMSYDYVCTDHMSGNVMEGSMWMQGNKQKIKAADPSGQEVVYINDGDEGTAYVYMPGQNLAFKIDVGEMPEAENPNDYIENSDPGDADYLGQETCEGVKCYKYRVGVEGQGSSTATMWLHGDYGMPVKVEVVQNGEKFLTTAFKNLQVGELPGDTFELPEGVQFQDMGEMLKDFQNAAQ